MGKGQVLCKDALALPLCWWPSHEGIKRVFQQLSWKETRWQPLAPTTADSWILQDMIVKANLPAEKYAAHSQAKYK